MCTWSEVKKFFVAFLFQEISKGVFSFFNFLVNLEYSTGSKVYDVLADTFLDGVFDSLQFPGHVIVDWLVIPNWGVVDILLCLCVKVLNGCQGVVSTGD